MLVCDEAGTIEEELLCWGVTVETEAAGLAEPSDGAVTADGADTADGAETADGAGRADTTDDTESVEWDDADTVVGVDMDELELDGTVTLAETALAAGEGDAVLATELCVCFDWTANVVGAEEGIDVFAVWVDESVTVVVFPVAAVVDLAVSLSSRAGGTTQSLSAGVDSVGLGGDLGGPESCRLAIITDMPKFRTMLLNFLVEVTFTTGLVGLLAVVVVAAVWLLMPVGVWLLMLAGIWLAALVKAWPAVMAGALLTVVVGAWLTVEAGAWLAVAVGVWLVELIVCVGWVGTAEVVDFVCCGTSDDVGLRMSLTGGVTVLSTGSCLGVSSLLDWAFLFFDSVTATMITSSSSGSVFGLTWTWVEDVVGTGWAAAGGTDVIVLYVTVKYKISQAIQYKIHNSV